MRFASVVTLALLFALCLLALSPVGGEAATWLTVNGATGGVLTTPGELVLRCDVSAAGGRVRFIEGADLDGNGRLDAGEPVFACLAAVQDDGWTDEEAASAVVQFSARFNSRAIGPVVIQAVDEDGSAVAHVYSMDYTHPAQSVSGAVRYEDGTPGAGRIVREQVGETSWVAFTGADGSYTLHLPAGGHAIRVKEMGGEGGTPAPDWVDLAAGAAKTGENFTALRATGPKITGVITESDTGHAVPGVLVNATEIYTQRNAVTWADAEGNYTLHVSAGTWRVAATVYDLAGPYGNATQDVAVTNTDVDVDLVLSRLSNRIYGAVTGPGSVAVTSGWVYATGATNRSSGSTNGQGRYEMWLPGDTYEVKVHDAAGNYACPTTSVGHVTVPAGGRADVAMVARGSTLSGRVVVTGTATGIPQAEVGIAEVVGDLGRQYADDFSGTTDGQGYFSIKMPAGPFEVWANSNIYNAESPGYSTLTFPPDHTNVTFSITPAHTAPTLRNSSIDPADGGFGGQLFTFAVTYASPNNLFPSDVYVVVDGWPHHMVQTSWQGNPADFVNGQTFGCQVRIPAGTHAYWFGAIDVQWFTARLPTVGTFTITPGPKGTVAGRITDSISSAPIAGAHVSVKLGAPTYAVVNDGFSDNDGYYAVTAPASTYSVAAFANDYLAGNWSGITVSLNQTTTVNFSLDRVCTLTGTVTAAPGGAPLEGVQIEATLAYPTVKRTATTGADGKYSFNELLPGSYTVVASKPWYTTQTHNLTLAVGEAKIENFALAATGDLMGQVRIAGTSTVIAGAQVQAYLGAVLKGTATSDANGVYEIAQGLPAGTYVVSAGKDGYVTQVKSGIAVTAGATSYVNFNLGASGTLMGQVAEKGTGNPIANASVKAYLGGVLKASATAGANGVYTISRDLAAGSYVVMASKNGYVTQTKGANVTASATTYLNFNLGKICLSGQVRQMGTTTVLKGATVGAYLGSATTPSGTATTDVNGIYQIGGLTTGAYTVIASKSGYVKQTKPGISVTAGGMTYVNFALTVSGKLMGQVWDKMTSAPIIGATVSARSGGVVQATGTTVGPYGIYQISSDLPAGTYTMLCTKSGYNDFGRLGIVVTAGQTTYVNFPLSSSAQ